MLELCLILFWKILFIFLEMIVTLYIALKCIKKYGYGVLFFIYFSIKESS